MKEVQRIAQLVPLGSQMKKVQVMVHDDKPITVKSLIIARVKIYCKKWGWGVGAAQQMSFILTYH